MLKLPNILAMIKERISKDRAKNYKKTQHFSIHNKKYKENRKSI
jgi:hypothetical protein